MAQVIWFFDEPTILACGNCDKVATHFTEGRCYDCGREMIEFTADALEYHEAIDHPENKG